MTRIKESANTVIYVNGNYIENQTIHVHQGGMLRKKNGLLFGFCSNISYLCTDRYTDIQIYTVILKKLSCVRIRVYVRVRYFWKHLYVSVCVFSSKYYDITEKKTYSTIKSTQSFFYSISKKNLSVFGKQAESQGTKTQHVETANTTRWNRQHNTLSLQSQHVEITDSTRCVCSRNEYLYVKPEILN